MHVTVNTSARLHVFSQVPTYVKVNLTGRFPPCNLLFSYEVHGDLLVMLSTKDKLPDENNAHQM